ncbi:hypothetical protein B0T19DRAFT_455688 [Cercophora scortea]|uniref:Uncharacterized protein n=1 Tax=Cercophora scortea TaxID=314031 RepID=A0AAE0MN38_9PEZI|nr:hypothetical protein B0T19DRAFT_455688 [Cercophora scortea]
MPLFPLFLEMDDFEDRGATRAHGGPYTAKHPVPTVQKYREHRAEIKNRQQETEEAQTEAEGGAAESKTKRAYESVKAVAKNEDQPKTGKPHEPYPRANRNDPDRDMKEDDEDEDDCDENSQPDSDRKRRKGEKAKAKEKSATEQAAASIDPKAKRKAMKKQERTGGGRQVTDPVTHLPIVVQDMTNKDLETTPENEPAVGSDHRTLTGLSGAAKSTQSLEAEKQELDRGHHGMRKLFPPPHFEDTKLELMRTYRMALVAGLGSVGVLAVLAVAVVSLLQAGSRRDLGYGDDSRGWWHHDRPTGNLKHGGFWPGSWFFILTTLLVTAAGTFFLVQSTSGWLDKKVDEIFEDETWDAARSEETELNESEAELPESVAWLNSLLASVWPLINPDLFASLVDMLEDVMQASLPRAIRMVSVDDMGQGSEAVRILGVKWLPTGAASQSVDAQGDLKPANKNGNDRTVPGEGEEEDSTGSTRDEAQNGDTSQKPPTNEDEKQQQQEKKTTQEGMEGEEGDFVNMEIAFAYRARSSGKSIKSKARNAHLYLKFYLPGGIAIPVWVEVRGVVGIMRVRLQLTPDPPFFDLCTLTFLGQPRADLSCVPLSKHSLNLMNVPLISSFVQSAIDAALAEYVAPKSLTLDLKDMLVGDDFKKDTLSRGVILVFIKRARGFKQGDGGFGPHKGSSDAYVSVSWGKFGKPVASTRVIRDEKEPTWSEWASILVSPDEINAEETLRIQLWDSDRFTADDDLGRAELSLKTLMHSPETKNRMHDRSDTLHAQDPDEHMPGTLEWSVGYFAKAHIQPSQFAAQTFDTTIRTPSDFDTNVVQTAKSKLREANWSKDESRELHQQQAQDRKTKEDAMIICTPPPSGLVSGILSIQIHNITGLEVAQLNRHSSKGSEDREDEAEQHESDMPDSYCTIILNHKQIYRTRTKPKNAKPFFNAGTERFVKDWRTAEVIVSVRDSREGEKDPLLGVVYLPLKKVFESRSQVMQTYPLAGGIGYGRARVSLVWRSVEVRLEDELRGWEYGTLEVKAPVRVNFVEHGEGQGDLGGCVVKMKTSIGKAKMHFVNREGEGERERDMEWRPKRHPDRSVFMAVTRRYASPMVVEFRQHSGVKASVVGLAVLWLADLPDEEERTVRLPVWRVRTNGKREVRRARNCAEFVPGGMGEEDGEGEREAEKVGEVEIVVRFWRGLGGYHRRWVNKEGGEGVKGVVEVLDVVGDEKMAEGDGETSGEEGSSDEEGTSDEEEGDRKKETPEEREKRKQLRKAGTSSGSDSDSFDNGEESRGGKMGKIPGKVKGKVASLLDVGGDHEDGDDDDGERGPMDQVRDYKKHHKQLHRKHRGVMQWKAARTLDWMADKVREGKGKVGGVLEHGEKGQGVETEV